MINLHQVLNLPLSNGLEDFKRRHSAIGSRPNN